MKISDTIDEVLATCISEVFGVSDGVALAEQYMIAIGRVLGWDESIRETHLVQTCIAAEGEHCRNLRFPSKASCAKWGARDRFKWQNPMHGAADPVAVPIKWISIRVDARIWNRFDHAKRHGGIRHARGGDSCFRWNDFAAC